MSVDTYFEFRDANDPEFLKAKNGTPEELEEWEDEFGDIESRPGAEVYCKNIVIETDDEYGGWIIPIADIPKDVTHIVIHRG
jgi:hypothetical protein